MTRKKKEPHASTLPRVTFSQQQVRTEEGSFAQLPCVAQGNPPPTYRWMKDTNGDFEVHRGQRPRMGEPGDLEFEEGAECGRRQVPVHRAQQHWRAAHRERAGRHSASDCEHASTTPSAQHRTGGHLQLQCHRIPCAHDHVEERPTPIGLFEPSETPVARRTPHYVGAQR
ncbi:peroxidasin [Caerostris extrusa]|uniref:Peroxidasin n=1 Tax=Caerostris extrusa TaxID=172846 RepID=A0AAV4P6Z0_CAEEX|nr:peroxidasin [Caerostris extrusa]